LKSHKKECMNGSSVSALTLQNGQQEVGKMKPTPRNRRGLRKRDWEIKRLVLRQNSGGAS